MSTPRRFRCLAFQPCTEAFPLFQWLKWFREAGAHLTKPGWSKPHTHSNPTNLALFTRKIALCRFNQGGSYYCRGGGSNGNRGAEPSEAPPLTLTTRCGEFSGIPVILDGTVATLLHRNGMVWHFGNGLPILSCNTQTSAVIFCCHSQ